MRSLVVWVGALCWVAGVGRGLEVTVFSVTTVPEEQAVPAIVLREDGGWFVLWHDSRSGDRDLYGQRFGPDGRPLWEPEGRPLVRAPRDQGWPVAQEDGAGGFFLVWGDSRAVPWEVGEGGRHLFMQRFDAEGAPLWEPKVGRPVATQAKGTDDHTLAPDGTGGVFVAWEDWRNGHQDIYAQHVLPTGETAWPKEGLPLSAAVGDQYDPVIAPDGTGGLLGTWWNVLGPRWTVSAQRLRGTDGAPLWGAEGVGVSTTEANQAAPTLAPDGSGGAYVVWVDFRNDEGTYTNLDLYAQRLSPEGVSLWSPEGAPLAVVPEIQQTPRLIPGRSGAALVVWTDARDVYEDLYVQRLTPDGISGEPNGRPLCRAGGRQREPAIAYDGRTFWVVWYDYRREYDEETYQDLYVQRLDARGNYLEAVEGVPFWTEPGQRTGLVLRAQAGVAVVAWTEIRGSESDVFAARIEATEP